MFKQGVVHADKCEEEKELKPMKRSPTEHIRDYQEESTPTDKKEEQKEKPVGGEAQLTPGLHTYEKSEGKTDMQVPSITGGPRWGEINESSSKPTWGKYTAPDYDKESEIWHNYESHSVTDMPSKLNFKQRNPYHFGHCHSCDTPIATRHKTIKFTCYECKKQESKFNPRSKEKGKHERDGEEEFN
jgi:hypothetical protein